MVVVVSIKTAFDYAIDSHAQNCTIRKWLLGQNRPIPCAVGRSANPFRLPSKTKGDSIIPIHKALSALADCTLLLWKWGVGVILFFRRSASLMTNDHISTNKLSSACGDSESRSVCIRMLTIHVKPLLCTLQEYCPGMSAVAVSSNNLEDCHIMNRV